MRLKTDFTPVKHYNAPMKQEKCQQDKKTENLTDHRCRRRALNTHFQSKDEQGIQQTIDQSAGTYSPHGNLCFSLLPQNII